MNTKNIKKHAASIALSVAMYGGVGIALATPIYAQSDVDDVKEVEETIENEPEEELVFDAQPEENQPEATNEEPSIAKNNDEPIIEESKENEVAKEETDNTYEEHKVSVITTKVDEKGNPLSGATMQIIDANGNIMDEWISNGTEHETMLPEGNYTLHELAAPEGYTISNDKGFSVKVIMNEINAGVDHDASHDVCWHYGGVALYYVESKGVKEEVYCVNQDWDEPHDINYDGAVLTEDNIKLFTPDSDPNMTNKELYNKVLDIIYHRSKVNNEFPELSESEIRFITEYALKNYTSSLVNDGMFRRYQYNPNVKSHFVENIGNGNALGQLAKHWWYYHGRTPLPEKFAELYYYLTNENDPHPIDMHLYIYSTKNQTADGENYQNLLGVRWFDPYDEEYKIYLTNVNELAPEPKIPEKPEVPEKHEEPKKPTNSNIPKTPQTGINTHELEMALATLGSAACAISLISNEKNKVKRKIK